MDRGGLLAYCQVRPGELPRQCARAAGQGFTATALCITALCPQCGIDAVLPSAAPIDLTPALLAQMHRHWF